MKAENLFAPLPLGSIAVIGLGHVGLPTALCLAEIGYDVIGVDCDSERVTQLRAGVAPFFEPGLAELLKKHVKRQRLHFSDDLAAAVQEARILFICVGTPQRENGEADLSQIESLARTIARNLNGYKLIVEKSTVPAVTGCWIRKSIERYRTAGTHKRNRNGMSVSPSADFDIASNPEFLQEGSAIRDVLYPDRIVCGVESERAKELLQQLYSPVSVPIVFTTLNTAELIKHAANAFLATKISFINFVADVCDTIGAQVTDVADAIGLDARIGKSFLKAGIGFGGYCLPKDLRAFIHVADQHHVDAGLLREVEAVNLRRADVFVQKLRNALWILEGKTMGVLGIAFKAGTDDVREAPSLRILRALEREGTTLQIFDPVAIPQAQAVLPTSESLTYCKDPYQAAQHAHALLILTDWPEFKQLNMRKLRNLMEVPLIVDGRNLLDPREVEREGFEYVSIGRPKVHGGFPRAATTAVAEDVAAA
jgi:UDPglucose 6-dehydrogenase